MLILARKEGEAIVINDDITIRVLEVKGGQARLGVEAPKHVSIHREEIYRKILEENIRAAESSAREDLPDISDLLPKKDNTDSNGG